MADTASSILLLRIQSVGSNVNLWGGYINTALQTLERASKGYEALAVTGDATISWTNYSASNSGAVAFLKLTGSVTGTLTFPGYQNYISVWNANSASVTIKCSGGTGVTLASGQRALLYCDGTDYYNAGPTLLGSGNVTVSGKISGLTAGTAATDGVNLTQMQVAIAAGLAAATGGTGGFWTTYTYTATGGETSKSGADDNGLTLAYIVGTEAVFLNGSKLVRDEDYTASTGTSITGLSALAANDVLEIVAVLSFSVANTYTQAQVDALLAAIYTNTHTWTAAQSFATTSVSSLTATQLVDISASSAGQIQFPAAQNPSSNANTLDDYEEGTWTPTLTFATPGDLAVTYSVRAGYYTKVGQHVFITLNLTTSAFTHTTASGLMSVTGLPFAVGNVTGNNPVGALQCRGITNATYTNFGIIALGGGSSLSGAMSASAQVNAFVQASDMPTGGTVLFRSSVSYQA